MTSKFLDPKNHVAFKKVFWTEQNKDILIHFINDVLGLKDEHAIKTVEFLKTDQDPEISDKKQSIVDMLCQDASGVQFIIEIQVMKPSEFGKRTLYYVAEAYCRQADRCVQYQELQAITITIADYVIFSEDTNYLSHHLTLDERTHEHNLKGFSFIFIELPKFKKTKPEELETFIEKWCYFFKYAALIDSEEFLRIIKDQVIRKAYEALDPLFWTEPELYRYGYEEGIEIGIKQGRQAVKRELIQKLIASGMSVERISEILNVSIDQIQNEIQIYQD